jgi:hypothetical protein
MPDPNERERPGAADETTAFWMAAEIRQRRKRPLTLLL